MTSPAPTAPPMIEGALVGGRYRLLHPIGAGAMGTVWAARHELLGREFAIKFARLPATASGDARKRFLEEAQIAGKLRHPNIVDVADFGETAEGHGLYLAMELLSGESLAEHLASHGPLKAAEVIAIAIEICRGLEAAHAMGVIHRDIKPENIFLARGSSGGIVPKLLDFGISRQVLAGDVPAPCATQPLGTPAYMSPEQALGESDIDRATDIWAMGVVLYEMATGRHPFVAQSYAALMARIADDPPVPLPEEVPAALRTVIDRCLAKRRADRYSDARALRQALGDALTSISASHAGALVIESLRVLSSTSRDPSGHALPVATPPSPPTATHRRWILFGGLATGAIAVLGLIWSLLGRAPDGSPAPAATPAEVQPAAARMPSIRPSDSPVTTSGRAPAPPPSASASSAAPSAAAAKAAPAQPSSKAPRRPPSRATNVDRPGF